MTEYPDRAVTTFLTDCSGVPAHVEVIGSGPVVLMVGSAIPKTWTRPLCLKIAEHGFTTVNFDYEMPEGWTRAPEPRTSVAQSEDAAHVLAAAGYDSAHVFGISRGGMTAFGVATRYPHLTDSLTLVCPVAGFTDMLLPEPSPPSTNADADPVLTILRMGFSDSYLETHLEHARNLVLTPEGAVSRVERADETLFAANDTTQAPSLVVEFGADQMVRSANPARYLAAIPEARHVVIEGAGHGWFHERPADVAEIFAEFIAPAPCGTVA